MAERTPGIGRRKSTPRRWVLALVLGTWISCTSVSSVADRPQLSLSPVEHVRVESHDGVILDGWIVRPEMDPGERVPVVLWSSPYFGQAKRASDDPANYNQGGPSESVPVNLLVEHGYAVALFNVRGTGNSGGCLDYFGPNEQRDQAVLVDWLANQSWSSGRVGMMGLSYEAVTAIEAAVQRPEALKTIVVSGIISDLYTWFHTPQGAMFTLGLPFQAIIHASTSLLPPLFNALGPGPIDYLEAAPYRVCRETLETFQAIGDSTLGNDRAAPFWTERRFIDDFPNVTAAVLLAQGFQDNDIRTDLHTFQDSAAWASLVRAPKWQLVGQWEHEFPNHNTPNPSWVMRDWNERLLEWFDHWLKGSGRVPGGVGHVDYQDSRGAWDPPDLVGSPGRPQPCGPLEDLPVPPCPAPPDVVGTWRRATSWPPAEARDEVLYLASDGLEAEPGGRERAFRSVPDLGAARATTLPWIPLTNTPFGLWGGPLCGVPSPLPTLLRYESDPLEASVVLAGNPFAFLNVTSSQTGGLVHVAVFDLAPEFTCVGVVPVQARPIAQGTADLRFHMGNLQGRDFPTNRATWIRVDLTDLAEFVPAGHRLAAVISYGDPAFRTTQAGYAPNITVHAPAAPEASHLVFPLVEGTLGGQAPILTYPSRPFMPEVSP